MEYLEIAKILANKVNKESYIRYLLEKVYKEGYIKGREDKTSKNVL